MPPAPPVILLPPSEGKAPGGNGPMAAIDTGAFPELADDRARVRDAVRAVLRSRVAAEKLLGVRGAHLDRALAEWAGLDTAPTLPAAYRYSGVVWGAVGVDDMPAAARRRLMARVLVPSGLWGVVSAADPIPAYRLKMGARVAPIGLLSAFWKPRVSLVVAARARRGAVIDLLPIEHAAAFDFAHFRPGARVRVDIVDDTPDGQRSVGHSGKSLKGALTRAIVIEDARTAADVADLRVEGLGPGRLQDDGSTVVFRRRAHG